VSHAIEASQRIMHNLRPAILEQGLVAALQWMASRFEKRTGIECLFRTSHEPLHLPARRAAGGLPHRAGSADQRQQARPGHAGAIDLSLAAACCRWRSATTAAAWPDDLAKARSFGMRGLHERADHRGRLGRPVQQHGNGTTLILSVPLGAATGPRADEDRRRRRQSRS
jgi:signal transduction histidine kinase